MSTLFMVCFNLIRAIMILTLLLVMFEVFKLCYKEGRKTSARIADFIMGIVSMICVILLFMWRV